MRLLPSGERAVLVELGDLDEVLALAEPVRTLAGVIDVVPGERTLLVTVAVPAGLESVRRLLTELTVTASAVGPLSRTVEIPVTYDGADLADVSARTGLTVAQIIEAHTATPWRVGFGGFAPGFAYLVGGDPRLEVPRRSEPRPAVPAGAVGLAGRYSGIYPRSSPGGWQLIGRTDVVLFDPDADPPALLHPGMTVRFVRQPFDPSEPRS
ncbi:MAG: 5-oxoprolinase subunit PxpB [Propionibacteriaceae bacterium]